MVWIVQPGSGLTPNVALMNPSLGARLASISHPNTGWSLAENTMPLKPRKMPSPTAQTYYRELCNITAQIGEPNLPFRGAPPAVTRAVWLDQMVHRGSINEGAEPNVKQAHLSKYQAQLIDVRWIAVSGKYVWPIRILGQGENWSSGDGCSGGKQPSSNHPLSRQKQP